MKSTNSWIKCNSSSYYVVNLADLNHLIAIVMIVSMYCKRLLSSMEGLHFNLHVPCIFLPCRGYNMGVRMIEDFLARTNVGRCHDFRDTADIIAKVIIATVIYPLSMIAIIILYSCIIQYQPNQ